MEASGYLTLPTFPGLYDQNLREETSEENKTIISSYEHWILAFSIKRYKVVENEQAATEHT